MPTKCDGDVGEKVLMLVELASYFMEHHLDQKEWLKGKLWLFRPAYWGDAFSKVSKVILSFQGIQLTLLVTNDKIWAFKQKQEFCKIISITKNLTAFQCLNTLLWWYLQMWFLNSHYATKFVNIWKTLREPIYYIIYAWVKGTLKMQNTK